MTIYWNGEDGIYSAHRSDANSFFEGRTLLFKGGGMPTVTSDGLEMVLRANEGGTLQATTRRTVSDQFKRPSEIVEFADAKRPWNPCLAPDGLKLYFSRHKADSKYELVVSTRQTRNSGWTKPQPVPLVRDDGEEGNVVWCFVASDALTVLAAHMNRKDVEKKGNLMVWWRSSVDEPFTKYSYIQIEGGQPIVGVSPRWVKATNELFFTRTPGKNEKSSSGIWVIRNFVPPINATSSRASTR
jgi:hypothetical protein